jgi:ribulose-phosphate 3-epimerase
MIEERGVDIDVQIDGGVSVANTPDLLAAGANVLVSGSGFYSAPDLKTRFEEFTVAAERSMTTTL